MINDIQFINDSDYTCLEKIVATIANAYQRNYEMVFMNYWNFRFKSRESADNQKIGERIVVRRDRITEQLLQYHGIRAIPESRCNAAKLLECITTELAAGRLVSLKFDQYYLPWATEKNRTVLRSRGSLIVTGIDQRGVHCIDVHGSKRQEVLPLDCFELGCVTTDGGLVRFLPVHDEVIEISWDEVVESLVRQITETNMYDQIRSFAEAIGQDVDFFKESDQAVDIENITLIKRFKDVCRSRMLFSKTLHYLALLPINQEIATEILHYEEKFLQISSMWRLIYSTIVKAFYLQRLGSELSAATEQRVREAAAAEAAVGIAIQQRKPKTKPAERLITEFNPIHEVVSLDLQKYYNNKGFAMDSHNSNQADFNGIGGFYLSESYPANQTFIVNGIDLRFPKLSCNGNGDNIACQEQFVTVEAGGEYRLIGVIAAAEGGSFVRELVVKFSCGDSETIMLTVTSWADLKSKYGETLVWEGQAIDKPTLSELSKHLPDDQDQREGFIRIPVKRNLFAKTYPIKTALPITGIVLPDCPNMHIFGIFFGK